MIQNVKRKDTLDMAFFYVDNSQYAAYIPLGMISSLHTVRSDGYKDSDNYYDVVVTTVAGKEFITQGFNSFEEATSFCEEQMKEISDYNRTLALAKKKHHEE